MAKGNEYFKLLKHPKWQEKRLKIMQQSQFECEDCGTKEKTLSVHHRYYIKGNKPWEYPNDSLNCLCFDCHEMVQKTQDKIQVEMGRLMLSELDFLLGYIKGMQSSNFPMVDLIIESHEEADGVANCWGVQAKRIIKELEDKQINGYKLFYIKHGRNVGEPSS